MQKPNVFRVLTLNVWGVPTARDHAARMSAIGQQIAAMNLDFAAMQEIWWPEHQALVQAGAAAGGLQHTHYFNSGALGSGLLVLSRYPIVEVDFYRFRLSGKPQKVWQGDYWAGKGIGLARVQTPLGLFDCYNLHPIAQYAPDSGDEYSAHRAAAMYESARYINLCSDRHPAIVLGDLNNRPDKPGYRIIKTLGGLTDCYAALHPSEAGLTFSPENPYRTGQDPPGRLDYVFVRDGVGVSLVPTLAQVVMTAPPPTTDSVAPLAYSDHFGVLAELEIGAGKAAEPVEPKAIDRVLWELYGILQAAADEAQVQRATYVAQAVGSMAAAVELEIASEKLESRRQFLKRLLCYTALFGAMPCALFGGWQSLAVVPAEQQSIAAMLREVHLLLEDGSLSHALQSGRLAAQSEE